MSYTEQSRTRARPEWENHARREIGDILSADMPDDIKMIDLLGVLEEYAGWVLETTPCDEWVNLDTYKAAEREADHYEREAERIRMKYHTLRKKLDDFARRHPDIDFSDLESPELNIDFSDLESKD